MWSFLFGDIFLDTSKNIIKESFKSLSLDLVDTHVANLQDGIYLISLPYLDLTA